MNNMKRINILLIDNLQNNDFKKVLTQILKVDLLINYNYFPLIK